MGTRSLVAALLLIHVTKVTDAQAADQGGLPPPVQAPEGAAATAGPPVTSATLPAPAAPQPPAAPQAPAASEPAVLPQAQPAPMASPSPVPPPSTQASVPPPPSASDSWIGGPQPYRRPTLVEQVADLQRSVRELEEERQQRLKEEAPTWAAHVNFLNLLFDEVTVGADYAIFDRMQVTAQASYRFKHRTNVTDNSGGTIGAGVRLYPASNGYRGWYVSPTASFMATKGENVVTGENATFRHVAVAATTGYQWVWNPVMLRGGVGFGRIWVVGSEINGRVNTEIAGWTLGVDGALGVVF